jgi:hypothetical protein
MSDCMGLFGRLFGHKFEPRYTLTPPGSMNVGNGSPSAICAVIDQLTKREYQGDVCARCGMWDDRSSAKDAA